MKLREVLIGSASLLAITAATAPAVAQDTNGQMETVVVTGIRASMERSIDIKRDEVSIVDAVSAEDIGKFPDKNIADALQRIPGVDTVSAAAGEGGFDENDRVSIRGTDPSLTQTMIDGHPVATGDWFVLDQYQEVGRSVSYTLLPSEIVAQAKVYKSQQADLVEGGVAGSVDIQTRKPLDLPNGLTLEGSAEAAYTTLRSSTTPQVNALFGWHDDGDKFGVIVQAFYEARNIRRDGQEFLGYNTITANPAGACTPAGVTLPCSVTAALDPQLIGVAYPTLIGSTFFEQQRIRQGALVSAQWQPSSNFELDVQSFYSHMSASNYNQNVMAYVSQEIADNAPTSYTVVNNTLTSASFPAITPMTGYTNAAGSSYAGYGAWGPSCVIGTSPVAGKCAIPGIVADFIDRPGSGSETYYLNADAAWSPSADLTIKFKGGYTHGVGKTSSQPAWEGEVEGGLNYTMRGITGVASVSDPGANLANSANYVNDWAWNDVFNTVDRETYGQIDAGQTVNAGPITSVDAGFRYAEHKRQVLGWVSGTSYGDPASDIATGSYPSGFGSDLPGNANLLTNVPLGNPAKIENYLYTTANWRGYTLTPAETVNPANERFYWQGSFAVKEDDMAAYLMANIGGDHWKGNFGVRIVETDENVDQYVSNPATGIANAFGNYSLNNVKHTYWDVLPSFNISVDLNDVSKLRFSAAETMSRPDYSALGGAVNLTDLILTGTGGNPNLKPVRAAVYQASYEWYYGPQSMLAVGVFYNDLSSYVSYSTFQGSYLNATLTGTHTTTPVYSIYNITAPVNSSGQLEGFEAQLEQPIWGGFGVQGNFTYADGNDSNGGPLVGDSKITSNISAYYENAWLSARLAYTYRSKMLVGLDRSFAENQDAVGSLDASVQVTVTDNISFTFDGLNLNNQTLKYYGSNTSQPRAFYSNGSQLYAGIRLKY